MAAYTVNSTPKQEAALAVEVVKYNALRVAQGQGTVTHAQYVNGMVKQVWDSYIAQQDEAERETLKQAWADADASTRAQVKTLLGVA